MAFSKALTGPTKINQAIMEAANRYGVSPDAMRVIAQIESGGNPYAKNPTSSAGGLFQFIDGTAKQYGLSNKFDPMQAADAGARLARDNAASLRGVLGREPTTGELYLAHQQGAGGARKLLANPNARAVDIVGADAVKLNGGSTNMTAREFANLWIRKADKLAGTTTPDMAGGSGSVMMAGGEGQDDLSEIDAFLGITSPGQQAETPSLPEATVAGDYAATGALDLSAIDAFLGVPAPIPGAPNVDAATGLPMAMTPPRAEDAFTPTPPRPSDMRGQLSAPGFEAAGQFAQASQQGPAQYLPNIAGAALSGLSGAIGYGIGGAADLAIAAGAPRASTQRLARDVMAMPDAFAGSPQQASRIATAPRVAGEAAPVAARVEPPVTRAELMDLQGLSQTGRKAASGSSRAATVLATQAAPDAERIAAARRLGIEEFLQPDQVTTNQAFREFSQAIKSVPGSALRQQEIDNFARIAQKADNLVEEIGGTTDLSALDASVKTRMESVQSGLDKTADRLYGQLRSMVPQTTPANVSSITNLIEGRAKDRGGVENLSSLEKSIMKRLSGSEKTIPASKMLGPNGMPVTPERKVKTPPTYAVLDDVRRDLTAARVKREGPFKDAETGLIKLLERELMADQQATIGNVSGAKEVFDAARSSVATRKALEDDMAALFGKNLDRSMLPLLRRGVGKLASGQVDDFVKLVKLVPEKMRQEVVASGLAQAFGKNAKNQEINFNSFSRWYDGLDKNKQAKTALFSNLPPEARKQLQDLANVSKGIALSSRERITTGRIMAVRDEIERADTVIERVFDVAKRSAIGLPLEAGTSAMGIPGAGMASAIASALAKGDKPDLMRQADRLIVSPQFAAMAKSIGKADEGKRVANFARSREFIKFAKTAGIQNPEAWLNAAILGSVATQEAPQ